MRLLNTKSLTLKTFDIANAPSYAIFSHRIGQEEVTYRDIQASRAHRRSGYKKLLDFCNLARSRGFEYVWTFTCCVDQSSSAELSESINSTFQWYRSARECCVYLPDVHSKRLDRTCAQEEFLSAEWHTRSWTLVELIAPVSVLFFNREWGYLGDKSELRQILSTTTSIPPDALLGNTPLRQFSTAQKMSWAAQRKATFIEDQAYSLLGVFSIFMPILYGEGNVAFHRLQQEIINRSVDHSLFAWHDARFAKSVLAPSPSAFTGLDALLQFAPGSGTLQGFSWVNDSLAINLPIIPWSMNTYLTPLECGYIPPVNGQSSQLPADACKSACIFLQRTEHENQFIRVSVDKKDSLLMSSNQVAHTVRQYGLPDRRMLIRQLHPEDHIRPAPTAFYGFEFSFACDSLFAAGRQPGRQDVVCMNKWDSRRPQFKIESGRNQSAGVLRLSGISMGHYVYLGFDRDFGPLCLITTRSPRLTRSTVISSDMSILSDNDVSRLLDINWLREQVASGDHSDAHVLAFKGSRGTRSEVHCKGLLLRVVFDWRFQSTTGMEGWHVSLDRLDRAEQQAISVPSRGVCTASSLRTSEELCLPTGVSGVGVSLQVERKPSGYLAIHNRQ